MYPQMDTTWGRVPLGLRWCPTITVRNQSRMINIKTMQAWWNEPTPIIGVPIDVASLTVTNHVPDKAELSGHLGPLQSRTTYIHTWSGRSALIPLPHHSSPRPSRPRSLHQVKWQYICVHISYLRSFDGTSKSVYFAKDIWSLVVIFDLIVHKIATSSLLSNGPDCTIIRYMV